LKIITNTTFNTNHYHIFLRCTGVEGDKHEGEGIGSMKRIAVIGGGASGLVAAFFASEQGDVVLFEKQKKIGRKILVTGNGRCNLTNSALDVSHYHGKNPKFVLNLFSRFGLDETLSFFERIGIPVVERDKGRLFPASLQASTVVSMLDYELRKRGVEIQLHRRIDKIIPERKLTVITAGRERHSFDAVILSAGSCAYPPVGASQRGYTLAATLGHTVHEPFPALLPITIPLKNIHRLEGIKRDCSAQVELDGRIIARSEGELLFTKYGISGPAALDISRAINENVIQGRKPAILLDLFPDLSTDELQNVLVALWRDSERTVSFSLSGLLHHRMPAVLLQMMDIDPEKRVAKLNESEKETIAKTMKALRLVPGEPRSWSEAVVAAGGVAVDEIDPSTMESRIVKNLYITGELLDIDGDSGGYNLQFAWSTGAIAGMAQ
jgi:predicted Rossmann fold flavoprotein